MCGIVGKIILDEASNVSGKLLEDMLISINHRGPDERGIYLNRNVGLGSARLSILDLEKGQQPLSDSSGRFWIVFNGEIFNYIELRNELMKLGYTFNTKSDTEVIVAGYKIWNLNILSKLNGQFAIAIWDKKEQELFLARDRVGICPLFFTKTHKSFVFGSEIKAIIKDPEISAEHSISSLCQVFTYWSTLSPSTVFKNIQEVSPGHYLKYSKGKMTSGVYWKFEFNPDQIYNKISIHEACDEFEKILTDAIKLRLRADVPVAAYLSGGIDSTTITALISKISPNKLRTFSIGFTNDNYDETTYQKDVVKYFNTNHKTLICKDEQIANDLPNAIWHAESPMLRSTSVPMQNLSKLVRQNDVKVIMTGEGADEILAGYDIFKEMTIRRFWANEPDSKFRPLLLKKLYPYIPQIKNANVHALKFFYGYKLKEVNLPYYSHIMRWNNGQYLLRYLHPNHKNTIAAFDPYINWLENKPEEFDNWGNLAKAQYIESTLFMSGYLLSSQGDRMIMSNSVEGRYPFLDHRLIEFSARLPEKYKMCGLNEKFLIKKIMANKIPESVLNRSKQAYRAPIQNVFFGKNSIDYIESLLNPKTIDEYGIFDPVKTNELFEKVRKSIRTTEVENMATMAIISTQLFYKMFILGNHSRSEVHLNNILHVIDDN